MDKELFDLFLMNTYYVDEVQAAHHHQLASRHPARTFHRGMY